MLAYCIVFSPYLCPENLVAKIGQFVSLFGCGGAVDNRDVFILMWQQREPCQRHVVCENHIYFKQVCVLYYVLLYSCCNMSCRINIIHLLIIHISIILPISKICNTLPWFWIIFSYTCSRRSALVCEILAKICRYHYSEFSLWLYAPDSVCVSIGWIKWHLIKICINYEWKIRTGSD